MERLTEDEKALQAQVPIGAIFRHYKGREYKVLHIGLHTEGLELMVVYQGLYDCPDFGSYPVWIRPLTHFLESVEVEGTAAPRFTLTHEPSAIHE